MDRKDSVERLRMVILQVEGTSGTPFCNRGMHYVIANAADVRAACDTPHCCFPRVAAHGLPGRHARRDSPQTVLDLIDSRSGPKKSRPGSPTSAPSMAYADPWGDAPPATITPSRVILCTYKKEPIHTRPWNNLTEVQQHTFLWIEGCYNRRRRHSTLNYLTPLDRN
jgi:transposase InsO family protein